MRRATRSAFKIVLCPAGGKGIKNAPPCGGSKFGTQRQTMPKRKETGSVFLFALTVQHPASGKQQHTAASQHRHGPVQLTGLGQNRLIRVGRGDRVIRVLGAYGIVRVAGTYRAIGAVRAYRIIRGVRLLREIGGVRCVGRIRRRVRHIRGVGDVRRFRDGGTYLGGWRPHRRSSCHHRAWGWTQGRA